MLLLAPSTVNRWLSCNRVVIRHAGAVYLNVSGLRHTSRCEPMSNGVQARGHDVIADCMDKNFKRTFATTAWTTQSEGTVALWCVPRVSSVS
jgi:hypothetical protein